MGSCVSHREMLRIRSAVGMKTFYTVECHSRLLLLLLLDSHTVYEPGCGLSVVSVCVWVESVVETWARFSFAVNRQGVIDVSCPPEQLQTRGVLFWNSTLVDWVLSSHRGGCQPSRSSVSV